MTEKSRPYDGLFITIEGGDGCGKSSLTQKLVQEFEQEGYDIFQTREPGGTPLSEHLRDLLLNPDSFQVSKRAEMLLFLTARVQHIDERILPALRTGKIVICERFNDSTVAYQACARHLGMKEVEELCHLACGGLVPDCTLLLDLDPEIGLSRVQGKKDRLESEKLQFHKDVRQGYLHLADEHPDRIFIVDAEQTLEGVFQSALTQLKPHLLLKPHE
ncbi:MAG: Thymidylate kinase [Chlamydiales bacterium]|nr:Thymidylate kinase [Chlamydiales bacterium]MCH9620257.1 Thymidylate kinase [Chlamydiales bacterium]MCH9622833.1 Thymidylate kinase [Chlamydiales bacterium]